MLVTSLEQMEKIVKRNRELMWDGWDVIHFYPSEKARTSKFGARIKGRWCIYRRISITEQGWDIPQKLVR
jgi:hypothetical protein